MSKGAGMLHISLAKGTITVFAAGLTALSGLLFTQAQDLPVEHPDCSFFGSERARMLTIGSARFRDRYALSSLTEQVSAARAVAPIERVMPTDSRTGTLTQIDKLGTIDRWIFSSLQDAGITPAGSTNDYEFIRRVTLDLTGRIPAPD